jgi:hypothetical protein
MIPKPPSCSLSLSERLPLVDGTIGGSLHCGISGICAVAFWSASGLGCVKTPALIRRIEYLSATAHPES